MFDIHKVKPVHGWREFFGEVGIIVLGVLIALAFEQVVEMLHWEHKVQESYDPLTESVGLISVAAVEQQIVSPCINEQLDILEKNLLTPGQAVPVQHFSENGFGSYVIRAPTRPWGDSVWNTVISEGISSHYKYDLRVSLDHFYAGAAQVHDVARQVDQLTASLNALALPVPRDASTISHFIEEIEQLRAKEGFISLSSRQLLGYANRVKLLPDAKTLNHHTYDHSGTIAFCRAHHLSLGNAVMVDTWSGSSKTQPVP